MKINLGSGYKRIDGFLNIDDDPLVNPDYSINLDDVNIKLPFEDNSIEEVRAHHILEHIGDGFIPLMKELYRVCNHGAILDIIVPHHFHEVFYGDPTHKRPISVNVMYHFDQQHNQDHREKHGSSSGMGLKYGIDFQMVWYDFEYDVFYHDMIDNYKKRKDTNQISQEDDLMFTRLMREANNVATNTLIKMAVIKE